MARPGAGGLAPETELIRRALLLEEEPEHTGRGSRRATRPVRFRLCAGVVAGFIIMAWACDHVDAAAVGDFP
jgi:hypothetical protein